LFVAIDPPPGVRERLLAWARAALGGVGAPGSSPGAGAARLLPAEAMHVTLCFLGNRPVEEIEDVAEALSRCEAEGGELFVGAPVWLPPRRPHALALEVHDRHGELARLHATVQEQLCDAIAWQPERRRFRGHVTVARLGRRRSRARRPVALQATLPPTPPLSFAAREIALYRSWLAPAGASYELLASSELSASSGSSPVGHDGTVAPASADIGHSSVQPSSESVGCEPSSHSGCEPSSQPELPVVPP
jgi:2'-5' RNA ligase